MTPAVAVVLRPDPWLSERLDRPCYSLPADTIVDSALSRTLRRPRIFVTAKIPGDQHIRDRNLQALGFRPIETALSYTADRLDAPADDARVRFARDRDEACVREVAATSFRYSRFHLDPAIPQAAANRIKADWAGNFFRGARGDGMVVAEADARVAGFLQLVWSGRRLVIDLIAVAPGAARRGLARAMIGFAAAHGTDDGRRPDGLAAGTQAANIPACRLYESLGFRLTSAATVAHFHGPGVDADGQAV